MPNQDTITVPLGEITVPLSVVQDLVRRHVLRSLLASNGHALHQTPAPAPEPTPEPEPDPEPAPEPAPVVVQPAAAGAP